MLMATAQTVIKDISCPTVPVKYFSRTLTAKNSKMTYAFSARTAFILTPKESVHLLIVYVRIIT